MKHWINKWLVEQNNNVFLQMFRYGSYGIITVSVCFFVLYFFTDIVHWNYLVANVLSFCVGVPINYFLCKKFIFSDDVKNRKVEFTFYWIFSAFGLLIDTTVLYILTDMANMYYLISKVFASLTVFLWNFSSRKLMYVIWERNKKAENI